MPAPVRMITPTAWSLRARSKAALDSEERGGPKGVAVLGSINGDLGDTRHGFVADVAVFAVRRPVHGSPGGGCRQG